MLEEDNVWKGLVSSMVSDNYNPSKDALSPEDAAWVESCLVKDPELSDSSWDAMTEALLDIISPQTLVKDDTSMDKNIVLERGSSIDLLMSKGAGVTESSLKTEDDFVPTSILDDYFAPIGKDENELFRGFLAKDKSKIHVGKQVKKAEVHPESSMGNEMEAPLEDIFKVWDLNIPFEEEDELVKQLEKALGESPVAKEALFLDDPVSNSDLGSLDDLISGITELSLDPSSGS